MDLNVLNYLRRRSGLGINPLETAPAAQSDGNVLPELDISPGTTLPDLDLTDKTSDDTGALTPSTQTAKLRDSSDDEPAPEPRSATSGAAEQWSQWQAPPSAPPLSKGDDEQSRQVWEYLKRRMDAEERPDPAEEEARAVANHFRLFSGRPEIQAPKQTPVAPELLQYLSTKNKDDSSTRTLEQRANEAEGRVKASNDRLALEKYLRERGLTVQESEEERKRKADEANAPLIAAKVAAERAAAADRLAKAKGRAAAGVGSGNLTEDIMMDDMTFEHARKSPDKSTNSDQQKKVNEKAASWGEVTADSRRLADSLEQWARAPSIEAKNNVLSDVSLAAQGLTRALGGGAMAEHEKKIAFNALGAELSDPAQVDALIEAMRSDPVASEKAVKQMSQRARRLVASARDDMTAYSRGFGYDPKAAKKAEPQDGEKVVAGKRMKKGPHGWEVVDGAR